MDFDEFRKFLLTNSFLKRQGLNACCFLYLSFFLVAIKGCRTGRHLFAGAKKSNAEELVECRVDLYQTPRDVHVSVFGKGANKETSTVRFEDETVSESSSFTKSQTNHSSLSLNRCTSTSSSPSASATPNPSTYSVPSTQPPVPTLY